MHELTTNLEPGNPDGHTVLRYLVEAKQMPLDVAIERVYKAVGKYAADYRSDQNKLLTGMVVTGVLGLPVLFPFGVPSLLIAGAIGASAVSWQELGAMRDRLKPEHLCLKNSVLLEQFIKWLAEEVKKRRGQGLDAPTSFQADVITTANILSAYEHTVFSVAQGEHLENNASDPILALFVAKLRQSTNQLPNWVMDAFRHLEQAEAQRSAHLDAAYGYMFGNLSANPVGQNTRLGAVDVPAQHMEGEHRLGKPIEISQHQLLPSPALVREGVLPPFDRSRIINESKGLMIIGDMGAAKTCVAQYTANGFDGYGIIIFDPHGMTDWGNAYVISKMGAIYEQMRILLDLLEHGDTTPLLIICDEWLEIRGDRRNKKGSKYAGLADDFIRLFSTKPRKFNKLAAFVLHSPNVEAAGVDSFLRENYLKIYLGRLAKKEFSHIKDCAYPCVLEDEQQEHPTHGHHMEFKPKGKAPRNLQPLNSAPITIPLAYMDGGEVKVCDRGWSDGQLRLDVTNIRNQLEMLYRDTGNDTENGSKNSDTDPVECDTTDTGIDTGNSDTDDTAGTTGVSADTSNTENDTKPVAEKLPETELVSLIESMAQAGLSQTQIICSLWSVEKNKAGWKAAYIRFKELTGES